MTRKEVDHGNEEEAQEGRQEQAGVLTDSRRTAVLLARSLARRRVVTDGRVAASVELYEAALERAK